MCDELRCCKFCCCVSEWDIQEKFLRGQGIKRYHAYLDPVHILYLIADTHQELAVHYMYSCSQNASIVTYRLIQCRLQWFSVLHTLRIIYINIREQILFFIFPEIRRTWRMWFLSPKSIVSLWSKLQEGGGCQLQHTLTPFQNSLCSFGFHWFTHANPCTRDIFFFSIYS